MRPREEIMKELGENAFPHNKLTLEVLLDIRELLQRQPAPTAVKHAREEAPPAKQVTALLPPETIEKMPWVASSWVRKDDKDRNAREGEDGWIKLENSDSLLIRMMDEAGCDKNEKTFLDIPEYKYVFSYKTFPDSNAKLILRKKRRPQK
jgi:hypothetical protein